MTAFSSFLTNQRGLTLIWNLVVLFFSVAALGNAQVEEDTANAGMPSPISTAPMLFFDLPSLSVTLDVEKKDNALIPFQDQLKENMEDHLQKFFENKLVTSEVGIPAFVDIDLESQLLWKELWVGPKETTEEIANRTYSEVGFIKKYEVRGIFNCKMKLQIEPLTAEYKGEEDKSVFVSQSLVDYFFLEAFQNEHYWDMMHGFLTNPLLRDIIGADFKVLDSGFVHPYDDNGDLLFESDDNFYGLSIDFDDNSGASIIAIVGSAFAIFFLVAISLIWYYLFVVMKGGDKRFFWKKKKIGRSRSRDEGSYKGSSVTGSTNSEDSDESGDNDDETSSGWASSIATNLDAWASSITSIPLRDVDNKRRKKRGNKVVQRPYFRPSNEHSSSLENITESDNESWCSSVKSSRSAKSSKSRYSRSRTRHTEESSRLESVESSVIYEGDAEDSAEDEEQVQSSPLLNTRQLIKLMPSEDEGDDPWKQGFAEI